MGITYVKAPDEVADLIGRVMRKYHPTLSDADVTVGAVMAHGPVDENGDSIGPALMHNGYQAAATVKINNLKARAQGMPDALITIDGDRWGDWNEARQVALIDHELQHLELHGEKDDLSRPRLVARKHDWQLGGFDVVAKRHGELSFEYLMVKDLMDEHGQYVFPFDDATTPSIQKVAKTVTLAAKGTDAPSDSLGTRMLAAATGDDYDESRRQPIVSH